MRHKNKIKTLICHLFSFVFPGQYAHFSLKQMWQGSVINACACLILHSRWKAKSFSLATTVTYPALAQKQRHKTVALEWSTEACSLTVKCVCLHEKKRNVFRYNICIWKCLLSITHKYIFILITFLL